MATPTPITLVLTPFCPAAAVDPGPAERYHHAANREDPPA
jgi:hypothetical protein